MICWVRESRNWILTKPTGRWLMLGGLVGISTGIAGAIAPPAPASAEGQEAARRQGANPYRFAQSSGMPLTIVQRLLTVSINVPLPMSRCSWSPWVWTSMSSPRASGRLDRHLDKGDAGSVQRASDIERCFPACARTRPGSAPVLKCAPVITTCGSTEPHSMHCPGGRSRRAD